MLRSKFAVAMLVVGTLVIGLYTVSSAQEGGQSTSPQAAAEAENVTEGYRRSGDQIPKYAVVDHFFDVARICRGAGQRNWARMMSRLGIEPGSSSDNRMQTAISRARPIQQRTTDLRPFRNAPPEVFQRVQIDALRRKVHDLSRVYYGLCDDLVAQGVDIQALEDFLEQEIRPAITMVSFPDPDYEVFEAMEEFEQH